MRRHLAAPLVVVPAAFLAALAAPLRRPGASRRRAGRRVRRRRGQPDAPEGDAALLRQHAGPATRYDERALRADFRRLWDTGFLEDLQIDVTDGPKGKVVIFRVAERKRIQIVDYRGSKDLTTTNIEDELKKREAQIKLDTFYDVAKARKVESIIKEMLPRRAVPSRTVKHEAKNIGGAGQQLSFVITDGPKAKIKEISFDGNTVYSDAKLRGKLKNLKEPGSSTQLARGEDDLHRAEVARGGREGPARRPGTARGLLPRPRLRHRPRRSAPDHVLRRQAGQEEADEVHEDRDPRHRGRRSTGSAR